MSNGALMPPASAQIGPYEILDLLGSGGMGVVYRARDTRLDREVAVKVLLPQVAGSESGMARFEREARAAAALSHPNILTIHDFGTHEKSVYAVMELLEGATLRAMLERGPLPVRKAVSVAVQIAHGLAAAHDRGIVHRDLKPENIGMTRGGQVKVLDFGLARDITSALVGDNAVTRGVVSVDGLVVGTVGYMAPEQVRGEEVDHRSDLFSFGIVLYEMLTNCRPFSRPTAAETLTAILKDEPADFEEFGVKVPPAVERVVRRCLEKHPQDRFHSARDLAFALENALSPASGEQRALPLARRPPLLLPAALLAAGLAVGAAAAVFWPRPLGEPPAIRFLTLSGTDAEPAASPAGDQIVYASSRGRESTLWIREVDGGSRRAIVERDLQVPGGHRPRFFADGKRVLFLRPSDPSESAFEIAINGGIPDQVLDDVIDAEPSPINDDGVAFVRLGFDASGGRVARLGVFDTRTKTTDLLLDEKGVDYTIARWSPDGTRIATIRRSTLSAAESSIVVFDRRWRTRYQVKPEGRAAFGAIAWNGDGHSLIATESPDAQVFVPGVLARILKIDPKSGRQSLLFQQGGLFGLFGSPAANATIDVAGDGRLVFASVEIRQNLRTCTVSDRGWMNVPPGKDAAAGTTGYSNDRQPAYSPDGQFVIFSSNRSGDLDLWIQSTKDGRIWPLTQDREKDWDPAFAPDGKSILWSSDRGTGHLEIWMADFNGTQLEGGALSHYRRVSADGQDAENPTATRDLRWIVYASANTARPGIWRVRPDGRDASMLVPGPLRYVPDVSPDGRFVAYVVTDQVQLVNTIHVAEVETGRDTGFQIAVPYHRETSSSDVTWGRVRWTPDSNSLLFIVQEEDGQAAVCKQRFAAHADTTATRQRLIGSLPGALTESLMMSRDGLFITVSDGYYVRRLALAEQVPGIVGRKREK